MARTRESLEERFLRMNQYEEKLYQQAVFKIAGVDEAGRGPLAGPVVAAAVVLDPHYKILGLNDSKKLSEKKRIGLAEEIKMHALAYAIDFVWPEIIDEINILEATKVAMTNCIKALNIDVEHVLLDAMFLPSLTEAKQSKLIQGDAISNSIAAASILAKTSRDHYMCEISKSYPVYAFEKHKGYGTKEHYLALDKYGPCPIHRKSFLKKWAIQKDV